jgi:hypothetical protein
MSLRDKVNRIFSRPVEPRKDWHNTRLSREERITANGERGRQIKELERRQGEKRPERMNEERAKAAREHPAQRHTPKGATQTKTPAQIEREAKKAVQVIEAREMAEINRKPGAQLLADATNRARKETEAAKPPASPNRDDDDKGGPPHGKGPPAAKKPDETELAPDAVSPAPLAPDPPGQPEDTLDFSQPAQEETVLISESTPAPAEPVRSPAEREAAINSILAEWDAQAGQGYDIDPGRVME